MERKTGGMIGNTCPDNLIAKLSPPPDEFVVTLKTPGEYERGTVLSLESDGTYEILGAGNGTASAVLADLTLAEDTVAVAYRSGHFNRRALKFAMVTSGGDEDDEDDEGEAESYELTAADENNLRLSGIFLSDVI